MIKAMFVVVALAVAGGAMADTYVQGYTKSNGTYVQPHMRSSPNSIKMDNYSSQGNANPYTGQRGYERNELSPPVYKPYTYTPSTDQDNE